MSQLKVNSVRNLAGGQADAIGVARVLALVDCNPTGLVIRQSFGVVSGVRAQVGRFTLTLKEPLDPKKCIVSANGSDTVNGYTTVAHSQSGAPGVIQFDATAPNQSALRDCTNISIIIFYPDGVA